MKKIGIFGIGSIGSLLIKYLIKNERHKYYLFNRNPKELITIHFNNEITEIPISLSNDAGCVLDWLIICIKEHHIPGAFAEIKNLIQAHTKIVVFQNGIKLKVPYANIIEPENIIETIIDCPVQRNKSGDYVQFNKPKITVPFQRHSKEFIELFNNAEIHWKMSKDFELVQWKKLIESSSMGALQVLHKNTCIIFKDELILKKYINLINEGIQVAHSERIKIPSTYTNHLMDKLQTYPDSKGSSMLSDYQAGNTLELNAKIGAIVKIANKNQIHCPLTIETYQALRAL